MNYTLAKTAEGDGKVSLGQALKKLLPYLSDEKKRLVISGAAVALSTLTTLVAPLIVSRTIDTYMKVKDMNGILLSAGALLLVFVAGLAASYALTINMGTVGRNVLWKMRNALFNKIQELPLAFFNQNQAGDLISRINNDTDKLNQLFAQVLMQLIGNVFVIAGAAVFLVALNVRLGIAALLPAVGMIVVTRAVSGLVKKKNLRSLQTLGGLSAEVQESLENFRVILVFNRLDYFRRKFEESNVKNYEAALSAGVANGIFAPLYGLASVLAQLITIAVGIYLIGIGDLTVGLLIGFLLYVNGFYTPLRQIASVWSSLQLALASLDRINEVLSLKPDMVTIPDEITGDVGKVLEFRNVNFGYEDGREILKDVSFSLEHGKTYALVGPTGGGKTTTASLMARLYDPVTGVVLLDGRDIRSFTPPERVKRIGFILQDPFLFNGTVMENIVYGNSEYAKLSADELLAALKQMELDSLLARFDGGLSEKVSAGNGMSLGQKQIIAFMRAVLRKPEILILDEATANIDTVTEQLLQTIIEKLPAQTTKVVIAHRLNTIKDADEIFFVNAGEVVRAGSMEHAVELLMHGKRKS